MKLYDENGYLNIEAILDQQVTFHFVVGGRATGKTFGSLKYAYEHKKKIMFLRRTQTQVDLIGKPEFSPFKAINDYLNIDVKTVPIVKYVSAFVDAEDNDNVIGYTAALSTFSNIRGFDASDVDLIIYDEFIPERHERPIKEEAAAFFNAYETINRNRELHGKPAVKVLCLANANDLANPLFMELNLIRKAEKMKMKNQEYLLDHSRGIGLFILNDSPISNKKAETALYKLTGENSTFTSMSLSNNFYREDSAPIVSRPLKEYKPYVQVGEITIYKHKNGNTPYYVSTHHTGTCKSYGAGETELKRFRRSYTNLWFKYLGNNIEFEEYLAEILFQKYFN